ncbi:MAG TPA: CoA transferase, partial [Mycobacterium sp.]|nr:CoA transferase [Mycobacterium sp.]
ARGMIAEHFDERVERSILGPGIVPVLSESPGGIRSAGPSRPGRHNDEVYTGLLGKTAAELESLRAEGVL